MKNIIFIRTKNYNDTLVASQLLSILERSVMIDSNWCCYSEPMYYDDITINMACDNMVYMVNNYLFSQMFNNIIVSINHDEPNLVESVIEHLNVPKDMHVSIFNLTNTEGVDVENFELANKEYYTDYFTIDTTKQLVRLSCIDTTDISAFKIAKIIEYILLK